MRPLPIASAALLLYLSVGCSQRGATITPSPAVGGQGGGEATGIVVGFTDVGGEIIEITTSDGTRLQPATLAHLIGTVYDSTRQGPLGGVRVAILGTDFSAVTDGSGEFHLAAPLEGEYRITFSHPWLDSVAYWVEQPVELVREAYRKISVPIPHVRSILTQLCPETADRPDFMTVLGFVAGEGGEKPASGARVTASWQIIERRNERLRPRDVEAEVSGDGAGFYVLCGIPTGRAVTIEASIDEEVSREAHVVFPELLPGSVLLDWDRVPGQTYASSPAPGHRMYRLDLDVSRNRLPQAPQSERTLSGIVTDRTVGQPLSGVTVGVNGRESTVTRPDGTFDIVDVAWLDGPNVIAVGRIGYQPWAQEIWLDEGDTRLALSVSLLPLAYALDAVEVTGAREEEYLTDVGFYRRQLFNPGGYFMDRAEIEERLGRVNHVAELLTGVVGVDVIDPGAGGSGASLNFQRGPGFGAMAGGTSCQYGPRIFVDGMLVETAPYGQDNVALSEVVRPEDVYAMEVYRTPSQIPAQYGGPESACGVLLIWTRRGR